MPIRCKSNFTTPEDPTWQSCCAMCFSTIRKMMWLPWNKNNSNNTAQQSTLGTGVNRHVQATDMSAHNFILGSLFSGSRWMLEQILGRRRMCTAAVARYGATGPQRNRLIQKQRQTKATLFTLPAHRVRPSRIRVRPLEVSVNKIQLKSFTDDNRLNTPRWMTVGHCWFGSFCVLCCSTKPRVRWIKRVGDK